MVLRLEPRRYAPALVVSAIPEYRAGALIYMTVHQGAQNLAAHTKGFKGSEAPRRQKE